MNTITARSFGGMGTAWYLFGGTQFAKNLTLDTTAEVASGAMSQAHAEAFLNIPTVIWAFYGLAVAFGVVGGIQLLRLKLSAWILFGMALLCDVLYFGWIRFVAYTFPERPAEAGILAVVVLSVGALLTLASYWVFRMGQQEATDNEKDSLPD